MKLPSVAPLDDAARARFVRVAGLLGRPMLDDAHRAEAKALLLAADWRPVPPLAVLAGVEALMAHHAIDTGFAVERLFDPVPSVDFARLGVNHLLRVRERDRAFDAFRAAGIGKAMLVKGAALAPFWPSPALRDMEDIDIVVARDYVAAAAGALASVGWKRHEFGWRHASGCLLDLAVPESPFARAMFDRAEPHPLLGRDDVFSPCAADHLVLVAVHAARNRGLRIWRDMADATLLADAADEALSIARDHGKLAEAAAFLDVFRFAMEHGRATASPFADDRARRLADLYRTMLADPISVFGLNALTGLSLSPVEFLRALGRSLGRARNASVGPGQIDPAFGEVPGASNFARQGIKVRWIWHLARSGRLAHYLRVLRASNAAFAAGKVFAEPGSANHGGMEARRMHGEEKRRAS